MSDLLTTVLSIDFVGLCVILYLLPSICAFFLKNTNKAAILILNVLLGWTFVGWVIALVWAYKKETKTTL